MDSISSTQALAIANELYLISGEIKTLPGDEDANFKITTENGAKYILKISAENQEEDVLAFQNELLEFLDTNSLSVLIPKIIRNKDGNYISETNINTVKRYARVVTFIDGRIWATINPKTKKLRNQLGEKAGKITKHLLDFEHPAAHRSFDWNLAESQWTFNHLNLFQGEEKELISNFQKQFAKIQNTYNTLPKTIIHGDVNDYNILVAEDIMNPSVTGVFDFGDAVYAQTVNDIAIVIAYASMEVPDPLDAALDVISGYQKSYSFSAKELHCLYVLVAMRLITTVTKAAIRKAAESGNTYHSISEQPAWDLLKKWNFINPEFAEYSFRNTCGLEAHPNASKFADWAINKSFSFSELFPSETTKNDIHLLDLKVSSTWIGSRHEFNNLDLFEFKINQLQKQHPTKFIADGYLEPRPIYTSSAYDKEGNSGPESRTVHLGVDFWLSSGTPVHTLFDAEVATAINDIGYKEYGGLIILKHLEEGIPFFTLYGHLSAESPARFKVGDTIKKGAKIGELGTSKENGEWSPHLHFQIMLSMMDYKTDFPGVTYPKQMDVWKSMCPDPNVLFKNPHLTTQYDTPIAEIIAFRKQHLGKSLSISYKEPLHIVRGDGAYLLDTWGRKYLDTVNNVAHVGHEHFKVVAAAQKQIAVLNTNTRYLNESILDYTKALLKKLPSELSVLHFVNSGSEATELALRMARTVTGQKEIMAIEVGYHGNTNAAMEVSSYKFESKGGGGKPEHTHILPMPDPYRGRHSDWEHMGSKYASYAQKHIDHLKLIDEGIAGFIGESIISCGGQIVPPTGYYKELYKTVRDAGGVCIADEVQTGFGRIGSKFWAFELHDVVPDILTMGKPAGNGHPLAIVACTKEIADKFANGLEFFNTFGGNPVSCAIGKMILDVIDEEGLQKHAFEVGDFLKTELKKLQEKYPIIGDVRGEGLFLGIELNGADKKPLAVQASYLANRMKDFKILMSTDGPDHNVLKIKPPMVFSIENAKELLRRLDQVLNEDSLLNY